MTEVVTGDDVVLPVQLYKDGAAFAINVSATVQARVIAPSRRTVLFPTVTCDSGASGANWAASLVVVRFSTLNTAATDYAGAALLEIEVNDGGKSTFFGQIDIARGTLRGQLIFPASGAYALTGSAATLQVV